MKSVRQHKRYLKRHLRDGTPWQVDLEGEADLINLCEAGAKLGGAGLREIRYCGPYHEYAELWQARGCYCADIDCEHHRG